MYLHLIENSILTKDNFVVHVFKESKFHEILITSKLWKVFWCTGEMLKLNYWYE